MKQLTEQDIDAIVAKVKQELMAEIKPVIKVGKVYKNTTNSAIWMLTEFNGIGEKCENYGFDYEGNWMEKKPNRWLSSVEGLTEATPQEWEAALIKEAERRYKNGDKFKSVQTGEITLFINELDFDHIHWDGENKFIYSNNESLFKNGIWAEVIKDKPLDEAKLIQEANELIADAVGCDSAISSTQIVTVGGKEYQLTVNLKLV